MINLLICLILSSWVAAIAILSVQNATAVSVEFLLFKSIQMPLGIVLAFSVAVGLLSVAVAQVVRGATIQPRRYSVEEDDETWE